MAKLNLDRTLVKVLMFLFIVVIGWGGYLVLVSTRSEPGRVESDTRPALVEVIYAESSSESVRINAMGTVIPSQSVTVFPEVTGRVIVQNTNLIPYSANL